MEIYEIIKLALFVLGLASLITAGFLVSLLAGFIVSGLLLLLVAFLIQIEINNIPKTTKKRS